MERAAALADALGKLGRAQEAQAIRQMAEHVREARGIAEPSKAATEPESKAAEPEAATHQLQNHVDEILASDAPCRHCSWGKKCTNATHKHFTETQLTKYATSHMASDGTPIMEVAPAQYILVLLFAAPLAITYSASSPHLLPLDCFPSEPFGRRPLIPFVLALTLVCTTVCLSSLPLLSVVLPSDSSI